MLDNTTRMSDISCPGHDKNWSGENWSNRSTPTFPSVRKDGLRTPSLRKDGRTEDLFRTESVRPKRNEMTYLIMSDISCPGHDKNWSAMDRSIRSTQTFPCQLKKCFTRKQPPHGKEYHLRHWRDNCCCRHRWDSCHLHAQEEYLPIIFFFFLFLWRRGRISGSELAETVKIYHCLHNSFSL